MEIEKKKLSFYEKHPEKKTEQKKCEICGGKYLYYNKSHHYSTKKHTAVAEIGTLKKQLEEMVNKFQSQP